MERLWGVGKVTAAKLRSRGLTTVGDVAGLPESALVAMLGPAAGRHLHALAHNHDPRPVQTGRRRKSVGAQHALGRRPRSAHDIDAYLTALVDRVTRRLRAGHRAARTVTLRLRFDDFGRATRSHTLPQATTHTATILDTARQLLEQAAPLIQRRGLTLVGVAVSNLENDDAIQLALPFHRPDRPHTHRPDGLDATLDQVRDRFGSSAITRTVLLNRETPISVPQLPD